MLFSAKTVFFSPERFLTTISNLVRNQDMKITSFVIYSGRTLSRNSLRRLYRVIRVFRWAISAKKKLLMRHITTCSFVHFMLEPQMYVFFPIKPKLDNIIGIK